MQIASGLHRVGSEIVNSYLIVSQDGITIIDAGLPGYWKLLQAELAAMGKSPGDVRALILTHGDTDHIGFAARLHRETGVAAYIHEADVDRARLKVKKPNTGWGPVKIGPLAGFLWYSARRGGLRPQPATELQTIADSDVLDVPGSPRIIHTPGRIHEDPHRTALRPRLRRIRATLGAKYEGRQFRPAIHGRHRASDRKRKRLRD